jgi:hypothetical protein
MAEELGELAGGKSWRSGRSGEPESFRAAELTAGELTAGQLPQRVETDSSETGSCRHVIASARDTPAPCSLYILRIRR